MTFTEITTKIFTKVKITNFVLYYSDKLITSEQRLLRVKLYPSIDNLVFNSTSLVKVGMLKRKFVKYTGASS